MENIIECGSFEEAIQLCWKLQAEEGFDFFRGQSTDWPTIAPSLLRSRSDSDKRESQKRLDEFLEWAKATPQMISYNQSDAKLTAIAQHYGVPTRFLDLSYDPIIASIFSKSENAEGKKSAIYCFKRTDLESLNGASLLEFEVENLWRLKAQRGAFIEFDETSPVTDLKSVATKILYPAVAITPPEIASIYPVRKSHLETVLDQFFFRTQVGSVMDLLSAIPNRVSIRRQTYLGIFKGRTIPDFKPDWIGNDPRWVFAPLQHYVGAEEGPAFTVQNEDLGFSVEKSVDAMIRRLQSELGQQFAQRQQIEFCFNRSESSDALCAKVVNRVWDGLRAHPYSDASLQLAIARTIIAVHRRSSPSGSSEWEEELWGEVQYVDACPLNGHLDGGKVSKERYMDALVFPESQMFHPYYQKMAKNDTSKFLHLVTDPWILYDFQKVVQMFSEQLIPSMAGFFVESCIRENDGGLSDFWGASFNPALLAFLSPSDYGMLSPLALERNIEKLILVHANMDDDDLKAVFCDALSVVLKDQSPYIVRFPDFSFDPRELWEIPEAIAMCSRILNIGGISVLEVFEEKAQTDSGMNVVGPSGLSAFHIWMIGNNLIADIVGKELSRETFEQFHSDLLLSNVTLEQLLQAK